MRHVNVAVVIALVIAVSWTTGVWAQDAPPAPAPDGGALSGLAEMWFGFKLRVLFGVVLLTVLNAILIGFFVEFFRRRGAR